MGLQRVPAQKFGGLDLTEAAYDLDAGRSPDLLNVRFTDPRSAESIEQRAGKTNVASGGSPPATPILACVADATFQELFLYGFDGDLYTLQWTAAGALSTWTKIYNSATTADYIPIMAVDTSTTIGANAYFMPRSVGDVPKKYGISLGGLANWVNAPASANDCVSWRGRVITCDFFTQLKYSAVGDPESPVTAWGNNFLNIYDADNSTNSALLVHKNNLYLFKDRSVWMIYDPNTFANRLLVSGFGTWGRGTVCSNPVDGRMYWWSPVDGHIHSSNGETDHVVETRDLRPLMDTIPTSYLSADADLINHYRMVVDPLSGSVLFSFTTSVGTTAHDNDQMIEICTVIGKPGGHPLLLHDIPVRHMFTSMSQAATSVNTGHARWGVFASTESAPTEIHKLFTGTNDDGAAITSRYVSSWAPLISEEPMERIRRVNLVYRGQPTLFIASEATPVDFPAEFQINPANYVGADNQDRTYASFRGPNKKGRYHRFRFNNTTLDRTWSASALEFAIRGGKEKK